MEKGTNGNGNGEARNLDIIAMPQVNDESVEALKSALSEFDPSNSKAALNLRAALGLMAEELADSEDLRLLDERVLAGVDTTAKGRVVYVTAYLKLLSYLKQPFADAKMREGQAKVALGFIRHAEMTNLAAMKLGRTTSDDRLAEEVMTLRTDLKALAEARASVIQEQTDVETARGVGRITRPAEAQEAFSES